MARKLAACRMGPVGTSPGCASMGDGNFNALRDADSFDKIVPSEFNANIASLAVMSYVLADMPERLNDLR